MFNPLAGLDDIIATTTEMTQALSDKLDRIIELLEENNANL
jgi:hypothetical protein